MPGDAVQLDDLVLWFARQEDECFARERNHLRDVVSVWLAFDTPDGQILSRLVAKRQTWSYKALERALLTERLLKGVR
jgi:hypothetical protein